MCNLSITIDRDGEAVSAQDYFACGEVLRGYNAGEVNDRFKFTEKERDKESAVGSITGYDYFGARYYDSERGQWTTIDPLWEKYYGWSPYNYTLNNPLIYVDPDGKFSISVISNSYFVTALSSFQAFSLFVLNRASMGIISSEDNIFGNIDQRRALTMSMATNAMGLTFNTKLLGRTMNVINAAASISDWDIVSTTLEADHIMLNSVDKLNDFKHPILGINLFVHNSITKYNLQTNHYLKNQIGSSPSFEINPELIDKMGEGNALNYVNIILTAERDNIFKNLMRDKFIYGEKLKRDGILETNPYDRYHPRNQ